MTLREAIARAIGEASGCAYGYEAHDLRVADAVLDAMIEAGPTEAMEDAGWIAAINQNSPNAMRDAWQAMIEAARAEQSVAKSNA